MVRAQPGVLADMLAALELGREADADLGLTIAQDPLLALGVLVAARRRVSRDQHLTLAEAVARLSPEFLRILAMFAEVADRQQSEHWVTAQRVAHLARGIAEKTGCCGGDAAWLAGLSHDLPTYLGAVNLPAWVETGLLAADEQGFLADAVHFHSASPARLKSAHPLVRVIQLAEALACRDNALENVDVRAGLASLGLNSSEALQLRDEAIEGAEKARLRYTDWEAVQFSGPRDRLARSYAHYASGAAMRDYFSHSEDAAALAKALGEALYAFAGLEQVVLYVQQNQSLAPAAWWPAPAALSAVSISIEDPVSTLAQAARGNRTFWLSGLMTEASVADAQIARILNAESMLAEPLRLHDGSTAVMLATNPPQDLIEMPVWKLALSALSAPRETVMPSQAFPPQVAAAATAPVVDEGVPHEQVRKAVHEASNPLTIMRNYVNLLSGRFQGDTDINRDLSIIGNEIERVAGILRGLTGRKQPEQGNQSSPASVVEVNAVISELVRLSVGTLFVPNKVSVQIDLSPDTGRVITNRDQLKQVLLNLSRNAVEAMPQGGKLVFASRRIERQGKPFVEISLRDTGPGLPERVKQRLFEPVNSSKGGDHAGLGLSICRSLVDSMGGQIECETGATGTCFRIRLPADADYGLDLQSHPSGSMAITRSN